MAEKYQGKDTASPSSGSPPPAVYEGESTTRKRPIKNRIWDSFKRDPNARVTKPGAVGADGKVFDVESAAQATAESPLSRRLKGRHLQMIAIGGSIGISSPQYGLVSLISDFMIRHRSVRWFWKVVGHWRPRLPSLSLSA